MGTGKHSAEVTTDYNDKKVTKIKNDTKIKITPIQILVIFTIVFVIYFLCTFGVAFATPLNIKGVYSCFVGILISPSKNPVNRCVGPK